MNKKFDEQLYRDAFDELLDCIEDQNRQIQELLETIEAREDQLENLKENTGTMIHNQADIIDEYIEENTRLMIENLSLKSKLEKIEVKEHEELHDLVRGFNNPLDCPFNNPYTETDSLKSNNKFNIRKNILNSKYGKNVPKKKNSDNPYQE